jgi:hypothetical protein
MTFDFLGFGESHAFGITIIVTLGIICGALIRREFRRAKAEHDTRLANLGTINANVLILTATIKKLKDLLTLRQKVVDDRFTAQEKQINELCDGTDCKNFEMLSKAVWELRDVVFRNEQEAKVARTQTFDAVSRIEHSQMTFTDGVGSALVKMIRESKADVR